MCVPAADCSLRLYPLHRDLGNDSNRAEAYVAPAIGTYVVEQNRTGRARRGPLGMAIDHASPDS